MSDRNDRDDPLDDDVEPPAFGPAALGLHRVGTVFPKREKPAQPIQILNARGMPARIRKRNKLFFDDDIVNDTKTIRQSPSKKSAKSTPIKTPIKLPLHSPNKSKKRKSNVTKYLKSPASASKPSLLADLKKTPKSKGKKNRFRTFFRICNFRALKLDIGSSSATKESSSSSSSSSLKNGTASSASATVPGSPSTAISAIDRGICQRIGLRLRNLLKLPKAHKWVSYEFFYSYIDKPLFLGENEFQFCLRESFPQLKTRMLTRAEWSKIRRLMGKPRRCSQTFFDEERRELERRRQKIRLLQSRKSGDISFVRDLPKEIPLLLPIGTKVTARLRYPQDGIFTGTIEAIYSMSSEYRVTFDRTGLGTHSIPDYEVHVDEPIDTIPVSNITQNFRQKITGLCYVPSPMAPPNKLNRHDPLLGSIGYKNYVFPKESIGGFQLRLLELIVRARKTLAAKQMKLSHLKKMNTEAETYKSYNEPFPEDYQQRYASIVIGMEKLNKDNQQYLSEIQTYIRDLTKDARTAAMLEPSYLREKCRELGRDTVQKNLQSSLIDNDSIMNLINDLSTIMYVASHLLSSDPNYHISKVLEGVLEETKNKLDSENVDSFQTNVHAHLRHLEKSLIQH